MLGAHFHLVVLDNWMADGEGIELCECVREQSPATRVVFNSAAARQSDRDEGVCAGAAAYVSKPGIGGAAGGRRVGAGRLIPVAAQFPSIESHAAR